MVFVVLLAIAAFLFGLHLRNAINANLPEIDGTLHVAGLSAPVTVTRDAHGVPSIQAANLNDALFAQGFVTAQDRLWQMDSLRRHAAGELAEILGASLVAHDKTQRTLRLRAAADRALTQLPADQLHQLEAYARGVNAFAQNPDAHLPVEFAILRYKPKPWTPRDTLLVSLAMNQDLATGYPTKLARETLAQHLAPELMADLYPVGSFRDHTPGETGPDLVSPKPEILQIPLDDSQSKLTPPTVSPHDLQTARDATFQQTCDSCRSGSNNWAVSGARSASGMPLVSNDMHLGLAIPDIWYEAALHTADGALDVSGFTLPGTPFVIVGRNAHVAWGFTNLLADVQDVYIEHVRNPGENAEYQRPDGTWSQVEHHAELIRVKGGRDINFDVQTTAHTIGTASVETPIITPLYPSEHRTLALLWNVYDPANLSEPFYAANTAADGPALVAAFNSFGGPALSLVYADDHNHIGFHAIGRVPIRGPAIQHAVAPSPEIPTTDGSSPADEEDQPPAASDSSTAPANSPHTMTGHPRLRTIGFEVPSARTTWRAPGADFRTRFFAEALRPRRRAAAAHPAATAKHAKTPVKRAAKPRPTPAAKPVETPEAQPPDVPASQPLYTIGSPIPSVPADSTDPAAVWSGYIPYDKLPAVVDPASGVLATANARVTPDGYPYAIANEWASPYRVERINKLLANRSGLTPADMLATQMDVHSEFDLALAHRIAYALDQSALHDRSAKHDNAKASKRLRQAADILRNWNGEVDINAAAPSIIAATRAELLPWLISAKIAEHDKASGIKAGRSDKPDDVAQLYQWGESGYALERLVLLSPARWLPAGVTNWNDLLTAAVERGLAAKNSPADLAAWSYSKAHPVELNHPLFAASPLLRWLVGVDAGSGPGVVGGDTSTVKSTARSYGPSERFTADLANSGAAFGNLPTGQSANPRSPWYLDQLPLWLEGKTLPLPRSENAAPHTLTLQP